LIVLVGTQEIHFGRKTNEIAKFSILDEKTKFTTILDEIWTKNGQQIAEKIKILYIHWHYRNAFTVQLG